MTRRLFRGLRSEMYSDLTRPWWRAMGLNGWWNFSLALYGMAAFAGGIFYGEVILFIPSRKTETIHWISSAQATFFWVLMAVYALMAVYYGRKYVRWLMRRYG